MKTSKNILRLFWVLSLLFAFGLLFTAAAADELTEGIFTYTVDETEKTATIMKADCTGLSRLDIPETLGGYEVKSLGNEFISRAIDVYVPKTVRDLSYESFWNGGKRVFIDEKNPYYSSTEEGYVLSKDKTRFILVPRYVSGKVVVPYGIKEIGVFAMANSNKSEIVLPDTVEIINTQAFSFLGGLQKINLPDSITEIGQMAFARCNGLKEVIIPPKVKIIRNSSFTECNYLKKVVIPEGVTEIMFYAFEDDKALDTVYLPSTLKKIESGVFGNCTSLTEINYAGSEEDWKKINIDMNEYANGRKVVIDTVTVNYNTTVNSNDGLDFDLQNNVLIITGNGAVTKLEKSRWNYFPGEKAKINTVILDGNITAVGADFFADMPQLGSVIVKTPSITFDEGAFVNCPQLENVVLFNDSSFDESAFSECAETVKIFESLSSSHEFSESAEGFNVVFYDFENGTLGFSGALTLDTYKLLDLTAAFGLEYENISKVRFEKLTLDGMRLYYYAEDGLLPVPENTLENCEIYPSLTREKDGAVTFNKLGEAVADKSVTDFFLIMTSESHGDINDPPIQVKDEDEDKKENPIISTIKRALRWIVTLMNILFKLFGRR